MPAAARLRDLAAVARAHHVRQQTISVSRQKAITAHAIHAVAPMTMSATLPSSGLSRLSRRLGQIDGPRRCAERDE
ncbi:MAG: hypothetical protein V9G13_14765 [Marmoricola sp.]